MRGPYGRSHLVDPDPGPPPVYDDGGSGLQAACESRFPEPDFMVACDARHTVWVKRADATRSCGVSAWQLQQRPLSEVLDEVEKRLAKPVAHC